MEKESESGPLIIDDEDRYSRLRLIGWWDQERIAAAKVLVVGAGALGNEVLKNLALLGVGNIYLIDFDTVDETNLTRSVLFRHGDAGQPKADVASRMVREINPDCQVRYLAGNVLTELGIGLIRDLDVAIGCLDNREARLWLNRMCWKGNTPWIDGGIQEINGVAKVFRPPGGACYECAMTDLDYQLISLRYSCPLLKQEDILQGKVPTAPTIASIIGGMQVQEALKIIHELPSIDGAALVFNGAANRFYETQYPIKEDCLSHETYDEPIELDLSAAETTVCQLFEAVGKATGNSSTRLRLDRDFLLSLNCRTCESELPIGEPTCLVDAKRGLCSECQQPMTPNTINSIDAEGDHGEHLGKTLRQVGIPDYDIVKVESESDVAFVLLGKDRDSFGELAS